LPYFNYTDRFAERSNPLQIRKVTTTLIAVEINGKSREIPANLNLLELLHHLEIDTQRVAIELNRSIVRKPDWPTTIVQPNAQIEIVMFVGGGSK
jgi:sulfur carrier protein